MSAYMNILWATTPEIAAAAHEYTRWLRRLSGGTYVFHDTVLIVTR